MKASAKIKPVLIFLLSIISFSFYGCSEIENNSVNPIIKGVDFLLLAKSQTLKRFPGTGGKFEIYIAPGSKLTEPIKLSVESDSWIEAKLNKTELTDNDMEAEVTICTSSNPQPTEHTIVVKALYNGEEIQLNLFLEIIGWDTINKEDS